MSAGSSIRRPRWILSDPAGDAPLLTRLRALRGLDEEPDQLHDPFAMLDMDRAVERIRKALRDRERILLFGDYDADGVTGTALLYSWLRGLKAAVGFQLPDRVRDGYGLKAEMIDPVIRKGTQLLITVDNGTSANAALERAAEAGIDTIVVDHHRQTGELPPAEAVLNPNRLECDYPFKGLAAVGVAFKLLQALQAEDRISYLDLVAIGTVADMAPLRGENRPLVRRGLRVLNERPRPGIRALQEWMRLKGRPITAKTIGWQLGPRINCAGRLEKADLALKALLAESDEEARQYGRRLEAINVRRQDIQQQALAVTEAELKRTQELEPAIVVIGEDWHLGVIGLIAGRVSNLYHRPVIALTRVLGNGVLKGSARSLGGFDITEAIGRQRHLLEDFGGHAEAAGLTLREENLQAFIDGFTAYARETITAEAAPELRIDAEVQPAELDLDLVEQIAAMAPFGNGNPYPLLLLRDAAVTRRFTFSEDRHLKLWVEAPDSARREPLEVVCWNEGRRAKDFPYGARIDLVFEPESNEWNGRRNLQLVYRDSRPSGEERA